VSLDKNLKDPVLLLPNTNA